MVGGYCIRAGLWGADHTRVVREGLLEEVISEQGPEGKRVSQVAKLVEKHLRLQD